MMINLALWYLRKRKVSVLMNMKVDGGVIQQMTNYGCTYDNDLNDTKYLDKNSKELILPEGKFKITYPS